MLREYLLIGCGFALYNLVFIMMLADDDCMFIGKYDVSGADISVDIGALIGTALVIAIWPISLIIDIVIILKTRKYYWIGLSYNLWDEN